MSQHADNFRFDITAWQGRYDHRDMLAECLRLAFADHRAATHWAIVDNRMVLYWMAPASPAHKHAAPFMAKTGPDTAAVLVRQWLNEVAVYPKEPDHDGSNSKGWRVFNDAWGKVNDEDTAVCGIEPAWLMHGK